jgi:glycine/betaine/sarcosine/D-proline reductase family selenoprotein B
MAKEFEAAGIPVAYVTALDALGQSVGANRIVRGKAITNVAGDPSLRAEDERRFRESLVRTALEALTTAVDEPTIIG